MSGPPASRSPGLGATRQRLLALLAAGALAAAAPAARAEQAGFGQQAGGVATELVIRALGLLGVNYKWGGNSPETGLDCSGLVKHVFHEAAGLVLPRRAEEMSRAGEPIARSELKPGDLVFFNTLRRAFSHVGIYIGDGRFVHAPSSGGKVRVERLSEAYWAKRFNGARRVITPGDGITIAQLSTAGVGADSLPALQSSLQQAAAAPARPAFAQPPRQFGAKRAAAAQIEENVSIFQSSY